MAANIPLLGAKKENYEDAMYSTLVPFVKFAQSTLELAKKFIYVSSIDCVGIPSYTDYDENIKLNPYTPYAVAKLSGEKYIESMTQSKNIPLTILRFSQVYGPNEPLLRIIPILLDSIKNDKTFNLYGTGEEKRRFLYVKDAAKAVLCALNSNNTGIYNIAGASIESINELIAIVEKTYNKKLILNKIDCFHKTFDNIPSIENARKLIDYKPEYTLDLGIKEIYNEENNG
jgi:UDP-glucose 4-epimerase